MAKLDPRIHPEISPYIAAFIADVFHYETKKAIQHPRRWYRDQVGKDVCSRAMSGLIREQTIKACQEWQIANVGPADQQLDLCNEGPGVTEIIFAVGLLLSSLCAFGCIGAYKQAKRGLHWLANLN